MDFFFKLIIIIITIFFQLSPSELTEFFICNSISWSHNILVLELVNRDGCGCPAVTY